MTQGDTVTLAVAVTNASKPVDVTGSTMTFTVRARTPGAVPWLTKTTASGIVLTPGTGGLATITLASADTAGKPTGVFEWGLSGTDVLGNVAELATGLILVKPAI